MTQPPPDADAWQRQYEGKLAELERNNERMTAELEQLRVTEHSADDKISVTVNSQGNLTDLTLEDALRQHGGTEVAAEILRLTGVAQGKIAERLRETMEPYLGDTEALSQVIGNVRSAPSTGSTSDGAAPSGGSRNRPPPPDDDEDWGSGSFLS